MEPAPPADALPNPSVAETRADIASLPGETTGDDEIADIMLRDSLNQDTADSAPQQSVANGWTANDLLKVIAEQGADTCRAVLVAAQPTEIQIPPMPEPDQRPAALLAIGVIGLALMLFTMERRSGLPIREFGAAEGQAVLGSATPGAQPGDGTPATADGSVRGNDSSWSGAGSGGT